MYMVNIFGYLYASREESFVSWWAISSLYILNSFIARVTLQCSYTVLLLKSRIDFLVSKVSRNFIWRILCSSRIKNLHLNRKIDDYVVRQKMRTLCSYVFLLKLSKLGSFNFEAQSLMICYHSLDLSSFA